jgi:hypothetical protein
MSTQHDHIRYEVWERLLPVVSIQLASWFGHSLWPMRTIRLQIQIVLRRASGVRTRDLSSVSNLKKTAKLHCLGNLRTRICGGSSPWAANSERKGLGWWASATALYHFSVPVVWLVQEENYLLRSRSCATVNPGDIFVNAEDVVIWVMGSFGRRIWRSKGRYMILLKTSID